MDGAGGDGIPIRRARRARSASRPRARGHVAGDQRHRHQQREHVAALEPEARLAHRVDPHQHRQHERAGERTATAVRSRRSPARRATAASASPAANQPT